MAIIFECGKTKALKKSYLGAPESGLDKTDLGLPIIKTRNFKII